MSPTRLFGISVLALSLAFVVWGFWPTPTEQVAAELSSQQMTLPPGADGDHTTEGPLDGGDLPPAVPESRTVVLEYPLNMRQGDADVIILTLDVAQDGSGATATAQFGDHGTSETPIDIPNVYDTHRVQAEARLDLLGMTIAPDATISLPLQAGQKTSFIWTIKPGDVGTFRGALWLTLNFSPLTGGETVTQPIYNQALEIDVLNLLGIGGQPARIMGVIGTLFGTLFTIEKITLRLPRRKPRRRTKKRK